MGPSFTAVESQDGKTITLTDTTNPAITGAVRSFLLTDYLGNALATLPLADGETEATYVLTKPTWINVNFINTGTSPFNLYESFGFFQIYKNLYGDNIADNCGCGCGGCEASWCDIDAFDRGAEFALPIGDAVRWTNDINAAYALLQ